MTLPRKELIAIEATPYYHINKLINRTCILIAIFLQQNRKTPEDSDYTSIQERLTKKSSTLLNLGFMRIIHDTYPHP